MNAPVLLAQLSSTAAQAPATPKSLRVEKPQSGQAVTVHLDGQTKLDFTDIASEKLTFVRVGERLIVLFDNQSTISIDPVFDSLGRPLSDIGFEMGPDRSMTGEQFAELFPITNDQSVLPAAGTPGAPSIPAGANFGDPSVDPLVGGTPLALLTGEDSGSQLGNGAQPGATSTPIPGTAGALVLNEDGLSEGLPGGPGDVGGVVTSFTGSLNVNFGSDAVGRSFAFAGTQPGLAGLTSGGEAVQLQVAVLNGLPTLIGYVGGDPTVTANYVFTISLDAGPINGSYTVTLLRPLDHPIFGIEDTLSLAINVIATDGSGDTAPVTIQFSVNDDSPVIAAVGATSLAEQTGGNSEEVGDQFGNSQSFLPSTETVALGISWGADNGNSNVDGGSTGVVVNGDRSLVFAGSALTALTALGLTSNSESISYALSANGIEIVATAGSGGRVVFTVSLSDTGTGSYTFTLSDTIDHTGVDHASQSLNFNIVATDADGDPVGGSFVVNITDSVPSAGTQSAATLDDDALPVIGNDGGIGDDNGVASTGGTLVHDYAADGAGSLRLTGAGLPATDSAEGAFSQTLSADGLTLTIHQIQNGVVVDVLTVQLADATSGAYTVTLDHAILHEAGNDENNAPFTIGYTVTDHDGDTAAGTLAISVDDDTPVIGAVTAPTPYAQDFDGGTDPSTTGWIEAGGYGHITIAASGDNGIDTKSGIGNYALITQDGPVGDETGPFTRFDGYKTDFFAGFTAKVDIYLDTGWAAGSGFDYSVAVNGQNGAHLRDFIFHVTQDTSTGELLIGASNNTNFDPVENLEDGTHGSVASTGWYTFEQSFHDDGTGHLAVDFVVRDEGGAVVFSQTVASGDAIDTVVGGNRYGWFTNVDIAGGIAIDNVSLSQRGAVGYVDEDDLPNGSDATKESVALTGDLHVSWGADNADPDTGIHDRKLLFTTSSVPGGLTSDGVAIVYDVTTNIDGNQTLTAYKGAAAPGNEVFTVVLNDDGTGSYTFTLLGHLDHTAGQGQNDLPLSFGFSAIDADGDAASSSFTVTVRDDVPVVMGEVSTQIVDEGDILTLASVGSSPDDGSGDGSLTGVFDVAGAATVTGSVAATVSFGADGAQAGGGFAFTGGATVTMAALGLESKGVAIQYVIVGDTLVGYANTAFGGYQPLIDRTVFTLTLDQGTGAYTFKQFDQLDHVAGNGQNFDLLASGGSIPALDLGAVIVATDGDGDSVTLSGKLVIEVRDDVPVAVIFRTGASTTIDESSGNQNDDTTSNGVKALFAGLTNLGQDPDMGNAAIYARDSGALVSTILSGSGADDSATKLLSLRIDGAGNGADSGLTTTDGHHIYLFQVTDTLVVGRIDDANGAAAFAVAIDQSGRVSIAEYLSLYQPDAGNPDDHVDLGGKLSAVVSVTDYDGDTVTAATSIGDQIRFDDDGPHAGPGDAASVSEASLTTQTGFDQSFETATDVTNSGFVDGGDYGALAIHASGELGIFTKTAGGHYALVTQTADDSAPFTRFGGYDSSFDGGFKASVDIYLDPTRIAAGEGFDYSVAVNKPDGTHLRDFIFHVGEDSSGQLYISASNNTGFDPLSNAQWATTVDKSAIGLAGWYTFEDVFRDNGGTLAVDMVVRDASGVVVFTQTIDSGDAIANVGGHRYGWFTNVDVADGIAIDNVALTQHDDATSATSVTGSLHVAAGADGLGALTFAGITDGAAVTDSVGDAVRAGGAAVYYHVVDSHTVVGSTQAGQVIFTVTLDPTSGHYDFTLEHQVDHPAAGADGVGLQFGYTVTDGDGDSASSSFTVTVNDDVPTAQNFDAGSTDENALIAIDLAGHFTAGADGAVVTLGTATVTGVPGGVSIGSFDVALDPDGHTVSFDPGLGFDSLAAGEQATLHIPYTVTDGDGDLVTREVTLTITGSNDAPVVTVGSELTGSATEAGDLLAIDEAGLGGKLTLTASGSAIAAFSDVAAGMAGLHASPDSVAAVLATIQGHGVDAATAIAVVWTYLDGAYVTYGPNDIAINESFTRLGVEYARYLNDGGVVLVDVVAKYTPDGVDAGGNPDRVQSLHDNLLGNLGAGALTQRYGATTLHDDLVTLIQSVDADLLDRPYASGNEGNGGAAAAHAWDIANGYVTTATGTLVATDVDHNATQSWSGNANGVYGNFAIDSSTGQWTYTLDDTRPATQSLGQGDTPTETFTATVTDDHGATDTVNVVITITGSNDAPVITTPPPQAAATLFAGGELDHVVTADVAGDHKFEIDQNLDSQIAALLAATPSDMGAVLLGVQASLGHAAGFGDAIAAVWDYLDDHYSYYDTTINAVGVRLGIEYANYVQNGGEPLTGIIVKLTPDGADAGTVPDRLQSMHDNLLGNLDAASIDDKFLPGGGGGSNPNPDVALHDALIAEIATAGLAGRPYYGGYEGTSPSAAQAWDASHGLLPGGTHQVVSGQLTATDVDTNDAGHLTWSLESTATPYGTMAIDPATGVWTYNLDNSLAATRALGAGDTVTESFVATVTDAHGGSDRQTVTITIHGTNDAPVITGAESIAIQEDRASNPGAAVAVLLGGHVTDVDSTVSGIAVVGQSVTGGHWEYSNNDGGNWATLSTDAAHAALLGLASLVRFVPDLNVQTTTSTSPQTQIAEPTLTFHAWDGTSGAVGDVVDLTAPGATGGSSAFSIDTGTSELTISNVVDHVFTEGNDQTIDLHHFANDPATDANWFEDGNFLDARGGDDIVILPDTLDALYTHFNGQTFDAGAGNNSVTGGDGADHILGNAGNDTIDGGADVDVAIYDVTTLSSDMFSFDSGNQRWVVTTAGSEGTDTLVNVESAQGVDPAGAATGKFLLVGGGSIYATIQAAVDAAQAGDTIVIAPGTYHENVVLGEGFTLVGIGNVTIDGGITGPAVTVNGGGAGANLVLDNIDLTGESASVLSIVSTADYDNVTFKNGDITGGDYHGLFLDNATNLSALTIQNAVFSGNGTTESGGSGEGAITVFKYNGDVTLQNVDVINPGAAAENGIQLRGIDALAPMGTVVIDNVEVSGSYAKTGVAIYNYTDANGLDITGGGLDVHVDAGWDGLNIDNVGGTLNLSGVPLTVANSYPGVSNDIAMQGTGGSETFTADDSNDTLRGYGGSDTLSGGGGDDTFLLGPDVTGSGNRDLLLGDGSVRGISIAGLAGTSDLVSGGSGFDTVVLDKGATAGFVHDTRSAPSFLSGVEQIEGTSGNDVIMVATGYSSDAVGGGIIIEGGTGNDSLGGGAGNDTLRGGAGADLLSGLGGADTLEGGGGNDEIWGGAGDDILVGGGDADSSADLLIGNAGNDTLYGNETDLGVAANRFAQLGENDVAGFSGAAGQYDVTWNSGLQAWQVTAKAGAPEGAGSIDTLYGIEGIDFGNNGTVDLSLTAQVQLFDASNHLIATFEHIQDAINAAGDGLGQYIVAMAGTYVENVTVDRGVEIRGANFGVDGDGARGAETIIQGSVTITETTNLVQIDGVEVLNTSDNTTSFSGVTVTAGAAVTIAHSVFASSADNGNSVPDDRAIYLAAAATGAIMITDNAFGGTATGMYGTSNWSRGIWSDGNEASLAITGNTFDHVRTAISLDSYTDATSNVSGNTINNSGTGISLGVGGDSTITHIESNTFTNVDADLNLRNLTTDITFDVGGSGNSATDLLFVLGGAGADDVKGTAGADFFDGRAYANASGNDTFEGGGGDDTLFGRDGTDTAVFQTTLSGGDFAAVSGIVIPSSDYNTYNVSDGKGWTVTTGSSEGTDTLIDTEVVTDGSGHRFLLVGNGGFDTIQNAVNAAQDGDTILVAAGTYVEQVTVNGLHNLTIEAAAGADVNVVAPADVHQTATSGSGRAVNALFTVTDSTNVQLVNLDVDGLGAGNTVDGSNANYVGVFYRNASGGLTDVDITGIHDAYPGGTTVDGYPVQSGNQRGIGLQVDNDMLTSFEMTGGSISDFQKNATVFNFADLTITGVTITGGGAQTINAQNGIQVGNSTGLISGNIVSAIGYAGTQVVYSGGLLLYHNTDLVVTNNTITGTDGATTDGKVVGIYVYDFGGANSGGSITGNTITDTDIGIGVYGDLTPTGIAISGNDVTQLDTSDPYAFGVDFEPTIALATPFDVTGSNAADFLAGAAGDDTFHGLGGDDTFVYTVGGGHDVIDGGTESALGADVLDIVNTGGATTFTISQLLNADPIQIAISDGGTIAASEIEDIDITLGNAGDTVNVTTPLTGTSLHTSTITVHGGGGDDTVDASGLTSAHRIVFTGGGGNDTFISGAGDDSFDGAGGFDKAIESETLAGATLTLVGDTLTVSGGGGSDSFKGVEQVEFADTRLLIVDGSGTYGGAYTTIAAALAAAAGISSHVTILVQAGTYGESLTISDNVTIFGANHGVSGDGVRDDETIINGQWSITSTDPVVIDGLRFDNVSPSGSTSDASLAILTGGTGSGHLIENTVFFSALDGGDGARDDRAIYVGTGATTGKITIDDNLIEGTSPGKYGTASWGRGIWSDGNGADLTISHNTITDARSGLNLDDSAPNSPVHVVDNTFADLGTAISLGNHWSGDISAAFSGNDFNNVDLEFNLQNLGSALTFDASGAVATFVDASPDGGLPSDGFYITGGQNDDAITGTAYADFIEAKGGNDTVKAGLGDDVIVGGSGVDTSVYATTLSAASFSFDTVTQTWVVTTGTGEGTDHLQGVEIATDGSHRFLLVGAGGFAHIQDAIDAALPSDTILIAPGTYTETHTTASGAAGLYINTSDLTLLGFSAATGLLITRAVDAQNDGPLVISGAQNNFGANHWIDTGGDNTVIQGLHLQAGPQTTNKLLEAWADNVTVQHDFIDVNTGGVTYSGAAAIYLNESGHPIDSYLIDGNILNDGIYVANGVGTPAPGSVSPNQLITNNVFSGSFDGGTGDGTYDMVAVQGQIPGIGWQPYAAEVPTISGNSTTNETVPFIFRMTEADPALFPSAAQVADIVAHNTTSTDTYAYLLNSLNEPDLDTGNIGSGDFHRFYVAKSIDILNLGTDTTADAVFGGHRLSMDAGDQLIVQSGDNPVNSDIVADGLTVIASANSVDLNLTMATTLPDGTPSAVISLTLGDYDTVNHLGANVDVTGNDLANTITGNFGANTLDGGNGDDTLIGGAGSDSLTGGGGSDIFKWQAGDLDGGSIDGILDFQTGSGGDVIDLSGLLSGAPGNVADDVRFLYTGGSTHLLSNDGAAPPAADGNVTLQVQLTAGTWTNVANIADTGANLSVGSEVIKMIIDGSGSHDYHV